MKKFFLLAAIVFGLLTARSAFAADSLIFDSSDNYLGACSLTDKSEWELTKDLDVTTFQIWYSWNQGETTLPVTVLKDGEAFATFEATRASCDPYQQQWCNADYAINKTLPKGTYSTEIPTARQCLKPGYTGVVRLYGAEAAVDTGTTPTTSTEDGASCKTCTTSIIFTALVTLIISFTASYFIFRKK